MPSVHFECCNPILRVTDMEASVKFYREVLGFENAPWGNEHFTFVGRDGAGIYLCRDGQGRGGAWVWLGIGDVEALYRDFQARGVVVRMPPRNFPWALEMHLEDADGNVLRLGSEPPEGVQFDEFPA